MTKSRLMAGASRFAHFSGLTRAAARRAAEDDRRDDDDAAAEEDEDDRAAEGDESDDDEPKGKKGRKSKAKASDDDDDDDDGEPKGKKSRAADDDDDDGDAEPKARSKKSRAADDDDDDRDAEDDDDDKEMTGRSAVASARRRERARCAAIFAHRAAANNVALAASLAFETTMTRKEAIAVLKGQEGRVAPNASPAPAARATRESRNAHLGGGGHQQPQRAGASWDRSFAKLGIKPRQA